VLRELNTDLSDVVERVHRSLVQIRNGKQGSGAGTIWHPQGLIVTNAHVAGRGPSRWNCPTGARSPLKSWRETRTATWLPCGCRPAISHPLNLATLDASAPGNG